MVDEIMIVRHLESIIQSRLGGKKAVVILGPRQCGKTTLLRQIEKKLSQKTLWLNGDDPGIREMLANQGITMLKRMFSGEEILIIDEAQRIENIGILLKMIIDNMPETQVLATGSSAFELTDKIKEPLTGRKWEYNLYPISFEEMCKHHGPWEEFGLLENRMIYGYYPEIVTSAADQREILAQLTDSYLYKDILVLDSIKKPSKIETLLKALAFQVGNEVTYHELSQIVQLDKETVEKYIYLLEQAFIIFRLTSFARNLRNELKRSRKIYFYDNGIRNMLISNLTPLQNRQDTGALWENFLVSERIKYTHYHRIYANHYFWRTHAQQEIDYIEERDGKLYAFEFKWNPVKKTRFPKSFLEAYPDSVTQILTKDNFMQFIVSEQTSFPISRIDP
jgi:predicted AAA+ superfamily ATPase